MRQDDRCCQPCCPRPRGGCGCLPLFLIGLGLLCICGLLLTALLL